MNAPSNPTRFWYDFTIEDNSMEPHFHAGDRITGTELHRGGCQLKEAPCVLLKTDGSIVFRYLTGCGETTYRVAALNQDDYPGEEEIPMEDVDRLFHIVGVLKPIVYEPAPELLTT